MDALQKRNSEEGELAWDKDDALALDFVTSASNLRAHIFGIPIQSRFDVKEKAGNMRWRIIPDNPHCVKIGLRTGLIAIGKPQVRHPSQTSLHSHIALNKFTVYSILSKSLSFL